MWHLIETNLTVPGGFLARFSSCHVIWPSWTLTAHLASEIPLVTPAVVCFCLVLFTTSWACCYRQLTVTITTETVFSSFSSPARGVQAEQNEEDKRQLAYKWCWLASCCPLETLTAHSWSKDSPSVTHQTAARASVYHERLSLLGEGGLYLPEHAGVSVSTHADNKCTEQTRRNVVWIFVFILLQHK